MNRKFSKFEMKVVRDQQRRIKPGECEKYVRLILDASIMASDFGRELMDILKKDTNINIEIRNFAENCLYWERSVGQRKLISNQDLAAISLNCEWEMEHQVIKLLNVDDFKYHTNTRTLLTVARHFRDTFPNKQHTLLLPQTRADDNTKELTKVLAQLQVLEELNVLQVSPKPKDYATVISKFTKAIAELPYKQQKSDLQAVFQKFVANDNKQCVRVDGTNGLGQLWQQHLSRLPLVTLEIAEAIKRKHNCPKKLIEGYESNLNFINEIADIRINRTGRPQPLHTERRVGNALSMKLHMLYNSRDPNACV